MREPYERLLSAYRFTFEYNDKNDNLKNQRNLNRILLKKYQHLPAAKVKTYMNCLNFSFSNSRIGKENQQPPSNSSSSQSCLAIKTSPLTTMICSIMVLQGTGYLTTCSATPATRSTAPSASSSWTPGSETPRLSSTSVELIQTGLRWSMTEFTKHLLGFQVI